ncbi:cell division topological specificity factor MinE [Helicobacter sp. 11S03491-1]|uniref:cell division topological specificity factor MinE n=1 Tax=Helicobacter sp. 11S03491-1 TaxID=1476196 RepID=UPI000BA589C2|nr:cell division topological specificity factor MinE [Helicobacter sp. 11S03491-1]PAF43038.1 cell division topological specificity factor MinE [Helicobacter sp. 11S03491-1]
MNLLAKWFGNNGSAKSAKDRLKIVLAHERSVKLPYMEDMKREILEVVQKYTHATKIDIKADSNQNIDTLEVEIILGK